MIIAGIRQVVTERLKRLVMYSIALGPRCFQVEDAELVGAKGLTISTALDCLHYYVSGECSHHLQ